MKVKPILLSAKKTKAILEGGTPLIRKTLKPDHVDNLILDDDGNLLGSWSEDMPEPYPTTSDAPYQEGDILWVRETWAPHATIDSWLDGVNHYVYRADYHGKKVDWDWRPSTHMPRDAARIFLRITDVDIEQAQSGKWVWVYAFEVTECG